MFVRQKMAAPLLCAALLLSLVSLSQVVAVPPEPPKIAGESKDAEQSLQGFKVPEGLQRQVFAAEPMLANPVAFSIDHRGRIFVCETFRQSKGVEDNRGHAHWLDDDIAAQTVEDRLAYVKKHLKEKASDYTKYDDRIRLLTDTDGDGKADKSSVFADGFNEIVDGTGAGVIEYRGNVYYTNIPHLWMLKDVDANEQAEVRQSLAYGFGVRYAFRGHDMHGLIIGPDGRLYFSIGDRGLNVTTKEGKRLINPSSGAVLRCDLDGSNLEMFATGLRNPQELAFDDHGNLFTGDNNSDSGDKARWVYVVEGGDTGWRMEYQYFPDRGPFNREKIWHPQNAEQPAYIIPPTVNFADGPSGLAYYPGTGLPEHFNGRFFLCDFRGGPANSGVRTFKLKPKGASFEMVDAEQSFWSVLATDVEFGPDGGVYVSDWVNGWNGEGKGRIYRFYSPEISQSEVVQQVKKLLNDGLAGQSVAELKKLLAHPDRRVRQEAQFSLVDKQESTTLVEVATHSDSMLAKLHAIWGVEQLVRRGQDAAKLVTPIVALATSDNAEVRAQVAKVIGETKFAVGSETLIKLLKDDDLRVRYFAAVSLGKLKTKSAVPALLELLNENQDQDPVLRHGAVVGLVGAAESPAQLVVAAKGASPAVRLGVVLALRRMESPELAGFLNDNEPRVVLEAARAIHDLPIASELPKLAALVTRSTTSDPLLRRVLNANFRLGSVENANAVAAFAARSDAPEAMRIEALAMLKDWEKPSPKDRVLNFWRPLEGRSKEVAVAALKPALPGILTGPTKLRTAAAQLAADFGMKEVGPVLFGLLNDKSQAGQTRADALMALAALEVPELTTTVDEALADGDSRVRAAGRNVLMKLKPSDSLSAFEQAIFEGDLIERQAALASLTNFTQQGTNAILEKALDQLVAGKFPADSRLDLLTAAEKRDAGAVKSKVKQYQSQLPQDDPAAAYLDCAEGGDLERGKKIFFERAQVSCVRCHKAAGVGGDVGPDLTKLTSDPLKTRRYLLDSIVLPNKNIAKGFDSVVILDAEGRVLAGIVKQENDQRVELMTAEGKLISVDKELIEERKPGKSPMPEDLTKHLTKFELRDLVEYLASLKE
ncbi:Quinoprotein glucose dehydrogenase B precursor [Anatilimnocola aggregata]|uniref:Quinoprotein glucose dehydrogenase B n=1 Tax=Anatilimnocola aggregata TaxID=2528021 RepID=A0A517YHZ6_9BACT|nr:PVC-type heme-binding CxxCH protein [Anatilimnocola aggregata]QDU29839.1 Quinoprotein glucose dehydrogenase B precursor [Anatilimnocola aggregata]